MKKQSIPFGFGFGRVVFAIALLLFRSPNSETARTPTEVLKEDSGFYDYFHPGRVYHLEPQQVHLSYWGDPTQMWVTWVTFDNVTLDSKEIDCFVEWGEGDLTRKTGGTISYFADEGKEKRIIYVHRALMTDLKPDKKHVYHVGGPRTGWSDVFWFSRHARGRELDIKIRYVWRHGQFFRNINSSLTGGSLAWEFRRYFPLRRLRL